MAFINMNWCIYTKKENCLDFSCFIWSIIWNKFQEINSCPYDPGQQSCTKDSLWFDKAEKLWRFLDVTEYDQMIWLFCLMDSISGLLLSLSSCLRSYVSFLSAHRFGKLEVFSCNRVRLSNKARNNFLRNLVQIKHDNKLYFVLLYEHF